MENKTQQSKFENEELLFSNNDQVSSFFLQKNFDNKTIINDHQGTVNVILDSYQQKNKLFHSNPSCNIDMEFQNIVQVNKISSINSSKSFENKLSGNINNIWKYKVGSFYAKAGKRYMGNVIIVSMWANEVYDNHSPKTYTNQQYKGFSNAIDFIINLIKEHITSKLNFNERKKIELLLNIVQNLKSNKITPKITFNDRKPEETINFGNIIVKKRESESVIFTPNHQLPIIDYREKKECGGATCSHNIRHLIDVIVTSILDLINENFENSDNFINYFISDIIFYFLDSFLNNLQNGSDADNKIFKLIREIYYYLKSTAARNKISKYIVENVSTITLVFLGKLEKHGIQLGKCANLVSGIKINSNENKINLKNNNKFFILFESNTDKLFSNKKTKYNFNTIHCIVELSNYKKLFNFLTKQTIPKNILNIFQNNIINCTAPSKYIYDSYLEYINKQTKPQNFNVMLKSFKLFKEQGWIIPKDINTWDILVEYILPTIFSNKIFIKDQENNKQYFLKNFKFNNTKTFEDNTLIENKKTFTDLETYNRSEVFHE